MRARHVRLGAGIEHVIGSPKVALTAIGVAVATLLAHSAWAFLALPLAAVLTYVSSRVFWRSAQGSGVIDWEALECPLCARNIRRMQHLAIRRMTKDHMGVDQ